MAAEYGIEFVLSLDSGFENVQCAKASHSWYQFRTSVRGQFGQLAVLP